MIVPPSTAREEQIAALARGLVQVVPGAGGLLAESIDLWISPIEKRKARWVTEVSAAINQICEELSLLPEALAKDERFVSYLMQTTLIALRNHQDAKLKTLRAALISSANTARFPEDEAFLFLRYVDELTPTHLALLAQLHSNSAAFSQLTSLHAIYAAISQQLASIDRTMFRTCLRDLASRSMVVFGDLDDFPEYETKREMMVTEASSKRPLTITDAGERFLAFVASGP